MSYLYNCYQKSQWNEKFETIHYKKFTILLIFQQNSQISFHTFSNLHHNILIDKSLQKVLSNLAATSLDKYLNSVNKYRWIRNVK